MTNEEIKYARGLIAKVGNPQGIYAEEVMEQLRKALDGNEAANLQIEELKKRCRCVCDHCKGSPTWTVRE